MRYQLTISPRAPRRIAAGVSFVAAAVSRAVTAAVVVAAGAVFMLYVLSGAVAQAAGQ